MYICPIGSVFDPFGHPRRRWTQENPQIEKKVVLDGWIVLDVGCIYTFVITTSFEVDLMR